MAERFRVRAATTDYSDPEAKAALDAEAAELNKDFDLTIEVRQAIEVVPAGRATGLDITIEVDDENVVQSVDSNGWIEYTTGATLRKRGRGAATRQTGPIDLLAALGSGIDTRGTADLTRLNVFDVKFPDHVQEHRDKLLGATRQAARRAAIELVDWIEQPNDQPYDRQHHDKKKPTGLYRVGEDLRLRKAERLDDKEMLPISGDPYLVLIHGTFSNTEAAFGGLRGTDEWQRLVNRYEGRVVAVEHKTLAVNPAQNALDVAEHLPARGRLHVVSHSRGGLVGDLLSLASHGALDPSIFKRAKAEDFGEIDQLEALTSAMAARDVTVERFVRVASPSGGTTLASKKLDEWASFLLNGLKLIPGAPAASTGLLRTFLLTFLDQKTDPALIPGIEAQIPRSPFIALINAAPSVPDDFAAIAGDVEPGILNFLAVKGSDLFYGADHDYVVDTRSMYQGPQRERGAVSFHWGKDVNHFRYFKEDVSRSQLTSWLERESTGGDFPAGFEEIHRNAPLLAKSKPKRASTAGLPTVVIVPDFMGTTLADQHGEVWPAPARLSRDGIKGLRTSTAGVFPKQVLAHTYQPLVDALEASYRVVLLPYDWRNSLNRVADTLAETLGRCLEDGSGANEPVHVVGHGLGGLAAQLLCTRAASTWRRMRDRKGRVVLLGVPHLGTHRSVQLATGDADISSLLRLLDSTQSQAAVARMFRSYPAVLETLPRGKPDFWSRSEFWTKVNVKWPPNQRTLDDAHAVLDPLGQQTHDGAFVRIVGVGIATPDGVSEQNGEFLFSATNLGDGAVTIESAAAPGPAYYVDASHGELPNERRSVLAVLDILNDGATRRLRSEPEAATGSGTMPTYRNRQLYPTVRSLEETAAVTEARSQTHADRITIRLDVSHGDLALVDTPVLVGHYAGSTLAGAEHALDEAIGGRLTNRDILGLYPGEVGEAAYVQTGEGVTPPAGLIVGLGEINDMNAAKVVMATTEGCLHYAMAEIEKCRSQHVALNEREPGIHLTTVLLGSYGPAGLSVEVSLAAIVKGVIVANQRLAERETDEIHIDRIQVIELYEDLAVEAIHAAHRLPAHLGATHAGVSIVASPFLRTLEGAEPGQPGLEYQKGDWRPIVVESVLHCTGPYPPLTAADKNDRAQQDRAQKAQSANVPSSNDTGGRTTTVAYSPPSFRPDQLVQDLVFTSIGKRARAEAAVQPGQRLLLERLLASVVNDYKPETQTHNTLYELLLPNFMKGQSRETDNLLWIVDAEASRYPWEMLATRVGDHVEPLAANVGMLRRLTTPVFREGVTYATGNHVLVIGDPVANLPRLPGARKEARRVAHQLRTNGYQVTDVISDDTDESDRTIDVLNALFAHEYRIVHVAAHGDYNAAEPARSGVAIGPDLFLTALEFKQLQPTPPLVFLNCCHLGKVDSDSNLFGTFHRFASSVSEQLIRDGVRAVVAAGWAVNDEAAMEFAESFYSFMLEGSPFGESVQMARRRVYERYEHTNTWGAYQCYGDPGFRLTAQLRVDGDETPIRSRTELKAAVARIAVDARSDRGEDRDRLTERLLGALTATPESWHGGDILYEAGRAFGELGDFERAIDKYELALRDWGAKAPLDVLEELANLEARHAVQLGEHFDTNRTEIDRLLKSASTLLIQLKQIGETPERDALIGSYHRRRAMLPAYRADSVKEAETAYRKASELYEAERGGSINPYCAINWATFRGLRGDLSVAEIAEFEGLLDRALIEAERRSIEKPEVWNRLAVPDAELARGLIRNDVQLRVAAIAQGYDRGFKERSSLREKQSVFDHLRLIADTLAQEGNQAQADGVEEILQLLRPIDN